MAYTAGNLHLRAGAPGDLNYSYDAASDTMVTVIASGYFNNSDDGLNLVVDDLVFVQATDGNMWVRVSAVSSGVVTTQLATGSMPANGVLGSASAALLVGHSEIGTGTGSAFTLPTPYAGAGVAVFKAGSATAGESFITDATGVTLNGQGDRTITIDAEGDNFCLVGVSTTQWRIVSGIGMVFS